jgi:predicted AlkP superfamily phosphohydrolase/phosphomutase
MPALQTLLLGLDGACRPVVDEVAAAHDVPTLQTLLDGGYADALESQLPPWTPSAWPSLYTGTNPGQHGVYGFLTFDGYDGDVVDRTDVQEYALWEILDDHGYRSVVVNVPVTHPPREIDGAIVPGYVAPEDPTCEPADAIETVVAESDRTEYQLYPPKADDVTRETHVAAMCDLVDARRIAFEVLAEQVDPHFGFLQFQVTDTVFHEHPGDWDAIGRVYEAVDDAMQRVLTLHEPDNVFVVSDHGIGEYTGTEFRVNDFLREEGYLETVRSAEKMPSFDSIERSELRDPSGGDALSERLLTRTFGALGRLGLTSQRAERVLERVGLDETVASIVPTDAVQAASETVDFQASTAYMRSRIELGVRVNLAGREPDGTVPQSEYDAVRSEIAEALRAVATPGGDPVFEDVLPREAVYSGPALDEAPDLVLVPAAFDHMLSKSIRGEQFGPPSEPWNHKRDGLFAATGPDCTPEKMADAPTPHIYDVAPTVLATFDINPHERMDGQPLPLVTQLEATVYQDFEARPDAATDGVDDEVKSHLDNLGYLE